MGGVCECKCGFGWRGRVVRGSVDDVVDVVVLDVVLDLICMYVHTYVLASLFTYKRVDDRHTYIDLYGQSIFPVVLVCHVYLIQLMCSQGSKCESVAHLCTYTYIRMYVRV